MWAAKWRWRGGETLLEGSSTSVSVPDVLQGPTNNQWQQLLSLMIFFPSLQTFESKKVLLRDGVNYGWIYSQRTYVINSFSSTASACGTIDDPTSPQDQTARNLSKNTKKLCKFWDNNNFSDSSSSYLEGRDWDWHLCNTWPCLLWQVEEGKRHLVGWFWKNRDLSQNYLRLLARWMFSAHGWLVATLKGRWGNNKQNILNQKYKLITWPLGIWK